MSEICQHCSAPMRPVVLMDMDHGESNYMVCEGPAHHTVAIPQPRLDDYMAFRGRVQRLVERLAEEGA